MILYTEGSTKAQASDAEKIMGILCAAYPGHPWGVRVGNGFIHIKHYLYGNDGWGMMIKTREVDHDAAVLQKKVVMAAGEWLERAGLVRGRENGDEIARVDGVPEPKEAQFEAVVTTSQPEMRTAPRPQALKGEQ